MSFEQNNFPSLQSPLSGACRRLVVEGNNTAWRTSCGSWTAWDQAAIRQSDISHSNRQRKPWGLLQGYSQSSVSSGLKIKMINSLFLSLPPFVSLTHSLLSLPLQPGFNINKYFSDFSLKVSSLTYLFYIFYIINDKNLILPFTVIPFESFLSV